MPGDYDTSYATAPTPKSGGMRRMGVIILLSFLVGIAAMVWAVGKGGPLHRLFVEKPVATPLSSLPLQSGQAPITQDSESGALARRVIELEGRLDRISSNANAASGHASRAEGLLVAFAARRAIDRGLSLGYLENALQDQFGITQPRAVGIVVAFAQKPVTTDQLQEALATLRPKLLSASAGKSWFSSFRDGLSNLIIVRKSATPSPLPQDRLNRAERFLESGRVDAAMAEVVRLPGAQNAQAWSNSARRLSEANRALDILEAAAMMKQGDVEKPKSLPPISPPSAPLPSPLPPKAGPVLKEGTI